MWGLVAYLNQKGISNGVMFNFQGNGPAWLGSPALNTGMEPEWAQMVASLLIYARQTNQLQFGLVGPDNEMDQTVQGVNMTASQYVTALHDLSQLLDTNGLSDLGFVGPDLAGGGTTYMPQMMADPVVMSKVAHFGVHSYQMAVATRPGCIVILRVQLTRTRLCGRRSLTSRARPAITVNSGLTTGATARARRSI